MSRIHDVTSFDYVTEREEKLCRSVVAWAETADVGKLRNNELFNECVAVLRSTTQYKDVVLSKLLSLKRLQENGYDLDGAYGLDFLDYEVFFKSGLSREQYNEELSSTDFKDCYSTEDKLDKLKSKRKQRVYGLSFTDTDVYLDFSEEFPELLWIKQNPAQVVAALKWVNDHSSDGMSREMVACLGESFVYNTDVLSFGKYAFVVWLLLVTNSRDYVPYFVRHMDTVEGISLRADGCAVDLSIVECNEQFTGVIDIVAYICRGERRLCVEDKKLVFEK